jgi:phosphatidylethanolamine/phosphatidyl-N-methylethanolamine N-methyltransferase
MRHGLAFALGCLRDPRRMGAIAPASRALARAIVSEVRRTEPGVLIEVGAGTGAITRELTAFPLAEVLNRCASNVDSLTIEALSPVTLVSSLPLLSMPRDEARQCVDAMLALIARQPGSRLIQYTYAAPHLRPFNGIPPGWRWRRAASVWANLPPATVWALERVPGSLNGVH